MNKEETVKFYDRMRAIKEVIRINDPDKYEDLNRRDTYWAPEAVAYNYSMWVNKNYIPNPDDPVALCVYSLLVNEPIEVLREKMSKQKGSSK